MSVLLENEELRYLREMERLAAEAGPLLRHAKPFCCSPVGEPEPCRYCDTIDAWLARFEKAREGR